MVQDDDSEPMYHEPHLFIKVFSLIGALIAVGAFAAMITVVVVAMTDWFRFKYGIFGFAWAICARLFQFTVRRGIVRNLDTPELTHEKKKMLGEQLIMLRITRGFIRVELVGSAVLFLVELLKG
jgi:hypothetical protein